MVFNTGMTGYQETLTDPSYARQIVAMTPRTSATPASTRRTPSPAGSRWPGTSCASPPGWRRTGAPPGRWGRRCGSRGSWASRSPGTPRAHAAPARARRDARRGLQRDGGARTGGGGAAGAGPAEPHMVGADLARGGVHPRAVRRPRAGAEALHGRGRRPRHQGDDPAPDGRSAAARCTSCRRPARPRRSSPSSRTGCSSPTGPATRPPRGYAVDAMKGVLDAGDPFFGICFGNQIFGRALGLGTYKLRFGHRGVNQPVQDRRPAGSTSRPTTTGSRWTRPRTARSTPRTVAPRSPTSTSTTAASRGCGCWTRPAFSVQYHPEAAAGPARRLRSLRPFLRADGPADGGPR